jgi:hypothetical protein
MLVCSYCEFDIPTLLCLKIFNDSHSHAVSDDCSFYFKITVFQRALINTTFELRFL